MRVGVIGCGGMGVHHAEVLRGLGGVSEVVCCDVSERARKSAEAKGFRTLASIEDILAAHCDVAFVVTPPSAHAANIKACLEQHLPVFTEKPIAATIEDSRALVAEAVRRNLPFQVGFELRYCGMTRGMREIVDSGLVGEPQHMSLIQLSGAKPTAGYMTKERAGGIFYEKLCHQVDLFRYWFGEPVRIMATAGPNTIAHYGIHDNVVSCLRFEGGKTGKIFFDCSRASQAGIGPETTEGLERGHFYELLLSCSRGSVTFDHWSGALDVVRYNHRPDNLSELVQRVDVMQRWGEPGYALAEQNGDFLNRIAAGEPPRFPAADALKSMEWVERAEQSLALGGEWLSGI